MTQVKAFKGFNYATTIGVAASLACIAPLSASADEATTAKWESLAQTTQLTSYVGMTFGSGRSKPVFDFQVGSEHSILRVAPADAAKIANAPQIKNPFPGGSPKSGWASARVGDSLLSVSPVTAKNGSETGVYYKQGSLDPNAIYTAEIRRYSFGFKGSLQGIVGGGREATLIVARSGSQPGLYAIRWTAEQGFAKPKLLDSGMVTLKGNRQMPTRFGFEPNEALHRFSDGSIALVYGVSKSEKDSAGKQVVVRRVKLIELSRALRVKSKRIAYKTNVDRGFEDRGSYLEQPRLSVDDSGRMLVGWVKRSYGEGYLHSGGAYVAWAKRGSGKALKAIRLKKFGVGDSNWYDALRVANSGGQWSVVVTDGSNGRVILTRRLNYGSTKLPKSTIIAKRSSLDTPSLQGFVQLPNGSCAVQLYTSGQLKAGVQKSQIIVRTVTLGGTSSDESIGTGKNAISAYGGLYMDGSTNSLYSAWTISGDKSSTAGLAAKKLN